MILYFHAPGTLNRWERFPLHTPQLGLHNNGWLCLGRQMTGCVRQSSGLLLLKCFPPPLSPANHLTHVFNCNSWSNYWKGFLPQSVDGQCCRQSVETGVHNTVTQVVLASSQLHFNAGTWENTVANQCLWKQIIRSTHGQMFIARDVIHLRKNAYYCRSQKSKNNVKQIKFYIKQTSLCLTFRQSIHSWIIYVGNNQAIESYRGVWIRQ